MPPSSATTTSNNNTTRATSQQCHVCHKSNIKLYRCSKCKSDLFRYCSIQCQKLDYKHHKKICGESSSSDKQNKKKQMARPSGVPDDKEENTYGGEGMMEARLEILHDEGRTKENGEKKEEVWKDAGSINVSLSDFMQKKGSSSTAKPTHTNKSSSVPTQIPATTQQTSSRKRNLRKSLPKQTKNLLSSSSTSKSKYTYSHSSDNIDTNLLLLFHGAGDSHTPYSKFANTMALPQTATLSIHASFSNEAFVKLPFDLGYTWFHEMDYEVTGNYLEFEDRRRIDSLDCAAAVICKLIESFLPKDNDEEGGGWLPECIFLFGYSAGACLVMEVCRQWSLCYRDKPPLGGAICVAGGIRHGLPPHFSSNSSDDENGRKTTKLTPILIMTGSKDELYPPKAARQSSNLYTSSSPVESFNINDNSSIVTIHAQKYKQHEMISSQEEVKVIMKFLGKLLIRRFVAMEHLSTSQAHRKCIQT